MNRKIAALAASFLVIAAAVWACCRNTGPGNRMGLAPGMFGASGPLITGVSGNTWLTTPSHCSGSWITCDPTLPPGTGAGQNGCAPPTSCVKGLISGADINGTLLNMKGGGQQYVNNFATRIVSDPNASGSQILHFSEASLTASGPTFSNWSSTVSVGSGPTTSTVAANNPNFYQWACPANGITAGANACSQKWGAGGDHGSNAAFGDFAFNGTITAVPYANNTKGGSGNTGNDLAVIASYVQTKAQTFPPPAGAAPLIGPTLPTCASNGSLYGEPTCLVQSDCPGTMLCTPDGTDPCTPSTCTSASPGFCVCTGSTQAAADATCPHGKDGTAAEQFCDDSLSSGSGLFAGGCNSICGNMQTALLGSGFPPPSLNFSCNTNADCPQGLVCPGISNGTCGISAPGPQNYACGTGVCGTTQNGTLNASAAGGGFYNWATLASNFATGGSIQDITLTVSTNGGKSFTNSATVSMGSFMDDVTYGAGIADAPMVRVDGNTCVIGTSGCNPTPNQPANLEVVWDAANAGQQPIQYQNTGTFSIRNPGLPDPLAGPYLAEVPVDPTGSFHFTPVPPHCLNGVPCNNSYAFPVPDPANCGPIAGVSATKQNGWNEWTSASRDQNGSCQPSFAGYVQSAFGASQSTCVASQKSNATRCCAGVQCIGTATTAIAAASAGKRLPQATINVTSTAGFPAAPASILVNTSPPGIPGEQTVTCTGMTATSFTGCTGGGNGTLALGSAVTTPNTVTGQCGLVQDACLPSGQFAVDGVHQTPIATDADPSVAPINGYNSSRDANRLHFLNLDSCNLGNGTYGNCLPVQQPWQMNMAVRHKPATCGNGTQPCAPRIYLIYVGAQYPVVWNGGAAPSNQLPGNAPFLAPGSISSTRDQVTNVGLVWYLSVSDNPYHGYASDWTTYVLGKDLDTLGNPAYPLVLTSNPNNNSGANGAGSGFVPQVSLQGSLFEGLGPTPRGNGNHWYRVSMAVNPYWAGSVSSLVNGAPGNAPGEFVFVYERPVFTSTCVLGQPGCNQAQYQAAATQYRGLRAVAGQWPAATAGQVADEWASMISPSTTKPVQVLNTNYTAGVAAYGGALVVPTYDTGYGATSGIAEISGNQYGSNIAITQGSGGSNIYAAVTFHQTVRVNFPTDAGTALPTAPFTPGVGQDPIAPDAGYPQCVLAQGYGTAANNVLLNECTGYGYRTQIPTTNNGTPPATGLLGINVDCIIPTGLGFGIGCTYNTTLGYNDCTAGCNGPNGSCANCVDVPPTSSSPAEVCACGSNADCAYNGPTSQCVGGFCSGGASAPFPGAGQASCNYGNQTQDFEYQIVGFGFQVGVAPCTGGSCPHGTTTISSGSQTPAPERVLTYNTTIGDYDFGLVGVGGGKWVTTWADNRNGLDPLQANITGSTCELSTDCPPISGTGGVGACINGLCQTQNVPNVGQSITCVHNADCASNVCTGGTCQTAPGIYPQVFTATFNSSAP